MMRWTYWLQGLGEHGGLTHEPYTLLNTRTLTTNAFMRWVNWNRRGERDVSRFFVFLLAPPHSHTFPSVPFYRLPGLQREIEANLGYQLPSSPYFKLHWRHVRRMFGGATELDICDAHTEKIVKAGQLPG